MEVRRACPTLVERVVAAAAAAREHAVAVAVSAKNVKQIATG